MHRYLWLLMVAAALLVCAGKPLVVEGQITGNVPKNDFPDKQFYQGLRDFFQGEFARAGKNFRQMASTGYRDGNGLFLDSVCYWSMQAECHYQLGEYREAVELHEQALKLYVDWLAWRDRTQFPPQIQADNTAWRQAQVSWGTPSRNAIYARIPNTFQFLFGRLDNDRVAREGGVIQLPNMQSVDLAQVLRCTAISMYRRNQLKGPLCTRDPLTNRLVASFTAVGNDGTLYGVWNSVLLGLAQSSAGKPEQAIGTLQGSLQFNGGMDHTLTAMALLEMGNASYRLGNFGDAMNSYLEASYTAGVFKQYDWIAESLVRANQCHLRSLPSEVFAPLANAIRWADRENADALQAALLVALLKNQTELGQLDAARDTLSMIRRAASGSDIAKTSLGVDVEYASAILEFASGDSKSAQESFSNALKIWQRFSTRLYQLQFVDQALAARRVAPREADLMYADLLREPTDADWLNDPCETICFELTDHSASLQQWFDALVLERRLEAAFGVADQIRRHRFYSSLPLGGRLLSLRWIIEAPPELLSEKTLQQRNDLEAKLPLYAQAQREGAAALAQLRTLPLICTAETDQARQQKTALDSLAKQSTVQEQILSGLALSRVPSDLAFARPLPINGSEPLLPPKTMLVTFMETTQGIFTISVTERVINLESTVNRRDLAQAVSELLQSVGNKHERNDIDLANLVDDAWATPAAALHKLLFPTRTAAYWREFEEVIIVPDGPLWYAPFELILAESAPPQPLRIRYSPMVSMAIPRELPPSQFPKTLLAGRRSTVTELQTRFDTQLAALKAAIPDSELFPPTSRVPTSLLSAVTDCLLVWVDDWKSGVNPNSFSWIPDTNNKGGHSLIEWLLLPWPGPRQIIAPQFSTAAGSGLKSNDLNGRELFLLACHAIAGGAQTILISRWNVGDTSSFRASIEFAVAARSLSATDAKLKMVEAIQQLPIDTSETARVRAPADGAGDRKSVHPFFWSGYLLIDTGWRPPVEAEPAAPQ